MMFQTFEQGMVAAAVLVGAFYLLTAHAGGRRKAAKRTQRFLYLVAVVAVVGLALTNEQGRAFLAALGVL